VARYIIFELRINSRKLDNIIVAKGKMKYISNPMPSLNQQSPLEAYAKCGLYISGINVVLSTSITTTTIVNGNSHPIVML
jgi:hypothetical protein